MTAPNKKLDQATSNLAIALRARETLCHVEKWRTGYRHLRGQYCLTGHILLAMGAKIRAGTNDYENLEEPNFTYDGDQLNQLDTILHSLGFTSADAAERYNDETSRGHKQVLERYDVGLKNWKDE